MKQNKAGAGEECGVFLSRTVFFILRENQICRTGKVFKRSSFNEKKVDGKIIYCCTHCSRGIGQNRNEKL